MKEIKHYVCEVCGTEYNEKLKAQKCEKGHKKPIRMSDCRYLSIKDNEKGYPISIKIVMEDGTEQIYKR